VVLYCTIGQLCFKAGLSDGSTLKKYIFSYSVFLYCFPPYINLSSQGDVKVENMVIRKYYRFPTNTKHFKILNALKKITHTVE